MIIPEKLAQKIVDTTMQLVHRNVNIMDRDGIIIATGHPHRYKTLHKGAKDVIETGKTIEIYPNELFLYPGALQGVNLPIVFDNQTVGVVGVFGHPDEVRNIAFLVKMITELILERDLVQREIHTKTRLREQFIEISVLTPIIGPSTKLKRIANSLAIDLAHPRAAVLIDVSTAIQKLTLEYGSSELVIDRVEDFLFSSIEANNLLTEQDIACLIGDQLILLKAYKNNDLLHQNDFSVEQIVHSLEKTIGGPLSCGVGAIANSVSQYHISYKQAQFCLRHCNTNHAMLQIADRDILMQHVLCEALNGSTLLALSKLKEVFNQLVTTNKDIYDTLTILLQCNLNINASAQILHIHRNTLLYRLNRLETETGLAPCRSIDDMILCRLLLLLVEQNRVLPSL
ncbi:CdaR family transcriptional regulator [Sporomusa acidovorans]|uniref:Carbohydrate diacid regulator n=1 Tax=Sporomusa acidovorans (strain ATCC 49682 / DSM 3132 / Mol) TaxID=1123286 RepID=A0ABZ3J0D6_SPOA4|nr:sugar diacid recognition domain-containing protein [Sporomusa acidovorans]OZC22855.1 carbohydrate diacid regulator [Sporomusa acidovorans DSM 3132]SDE53131.1 carbohydrate diacid regulator [Sporomusa acidovorans]